MRNSGAGLHSTSVVRRVTLALGDDRHAHMRTCAAALPLVLVALTLGGCFGQHCVRVVNGWTFPEFASDGTLNMVRYSATTFTVCRPLFGWR